MQFYLLSEAGLTLAPQIDQSNWRIVLELQLLGRQPSVDGLRASVEYGDGLFPVALIGPWAVIVAADFSEPPTPEFDVDALPLWVPAEQAEGIALPPIVTAAPPSQTRMA